MGVRGEFPEAGRVVCFHPFLTNFECRSSFPHVIQPFPRRFGEEHAPSQKSLPTERAVLATVLGLYWFGRMEEFTSKASTRDSLGSVDSVTAQTQSELELDRAAHLETMAAVEQTRGRLRQELAERAKWTLAREARVLAIQQSSKAHGDGLEQSMADARDMLARIDKEERKQNFEQDSEVSVEQQRLEARTAGLHATHVETRRLQDDLMRKREAFLQGRDALQGALQGLQEERLDMQDWFYMPAARLSVPPLSPARRKLR